jgi:hypothetical protein
MGHSSLREQEKEQSQQASYWWTGWKLYPTIGTSWRDWWKLIIEDWQGPPSIFGDRHNIGFYF